MARPTFEFPAGDYTVKLVFTNSNGYRSEEDIDLARLSRWINQEIRSAYADGVEAKAYEIQKALGIIR